MTRSPADARRFLLDRIDFERRPAETPEAFRLDGIRALLAALGDPQERIPVVHVAGTKGKGSTAAMIAAGLSANGLRTGLYTSPHLSQLEERFRVDEALVDEPRFVELVARLEEACRLLPSPPTFFEAVTALAWLHFATAPVDIAVLEVGIGGRLDATNVCRPESTVVTNASLDHTRLLGDTPAAIAGEKAGIVKPGIPCASGVLEPSARSVLREVCRGRAAPLWEWTAEIVAEVDQAPESFPPRYRARVRTPHRDWPSLVVPLAGRHQVANAGLALAALDHLAERGWAIDPERSVRGIESLEWPLRFETVRREPWVVCDAAHNEASIAALVETLSHWQGGRRFAIFAAARDKDYVTMLRLLVPAFDEVILTRFVGNPRSVAPDELLAAARTVGGGTPRFRVADDPFAAWSIVAEEADPADLVCATGSFFLAAELREWLLTAGHPTTAGSRGSAGSRPPI